MKNVRSKQASISINSCTEVSKTQFFLGASLNKHSKNTHVLSALTLFNENNSLLVKLSRGVEWIRCSVVQP